MKIKLIKLSLVTALVSGLFAESIYDAIGLVINTNINMWGGNKDEVDIPPHKDIDKMLIVIFQALYHSSVAYSLRDETIYLKQKLFVKQ